MATRKKADAVAEAPTVPMSIKEFAAKMREKSIVAATEVANDTQADQVAESLIKDLNAQKREVTLKLLGLDNRWGRWEVDHCNGRQSPITEYLARGVQEEVMKWVNEAVIEVLTEERKLKIKNTAKAAIRKEIEDQVVNKTASYRLKEFVEPIIKSMMEQSADEVREELGLETKVGKYNG